MATKQKAIVDPVRRAVELRKTIRTNDGILVVDFSDTLQGPDTSKVVDLMPNIASGELVFRTKINVKEIDPIAAEEYGLPYFDVAKKTSREIEDFVKKSDFDFPLWFKHNTGFSMKKIIDYNAPFIVQVAGCNFHDGSTAGGCMYCFVDDKSNNGIPGKGKTFLNANDAIDSMIEASCKINRAYAEKGVQASMKVLRVSGGEPTIVLDWILDLWRKIEERGLDFVGQIDSNLSTGSVVDYFEKEGIYEKNILKKLARFPVKVLAAVKGTDAGNLEGNVQSAATIEAQIYSIKKFVEAGFDVYPQLYNPNPSTLEDFLELMDSEIQNFSLRAHIGPLKLYGPNRERLSLEAEMQGIPAEDFISAKKKEWERNYADSCAVVDEYLWRTYGVGYKELPRPDIKLSVRRACRKFYK